MYLTMFFWAAWLVLVRSKLDDCSSIPAVTDEDMGQIFTEWKQNITKRKPIV